MKRRGRKPKVEPTVCECLPCRLRDAGATWAEAGSIIERAALHTETSEKEKTP